MAQAGAVRARLGAGVPVAVGMRNWRPFIGDAIAELTGAGVTRIIGIPLTPQFSTLSVQKYHDAAAAAVPPGVQFEGVRSFYSHPLLLQAFAERIGDTPPQAGDALVFTAHSLPVRVIQAGDRYAEEVAVTAHGVAERIGCAHYTVAYQSAGRTNEPWMGPELGQVIGELAARGRSSVLVVPIGFVCDHTEILFDIDVEAAAVARDRGMTLRRTESLNASPTFIAMLEDVIRGFL
jgi:ferrochelatase